MSYSPWHRCPLSGAVENLARIQLIPDSVVDEDEIKVTILHSESRLNSNEGITGSPYGMVLGPEARRITVLSRRAT